MNNSCEISGVNVQVLLSSRETAGRFAICLVETAEKSGLPKHVHLYEDEWVYVLQGEYVFDAKGVQTQASAGTSMYLPRGTSYSMQGAGRFLVVAQPGGMDLFVGDLGAAAGSGKALDDATLTPILEKHGIVLQAL